MGHSSSWEVVPVSHTRMSQAREPHAHLQGHMLTAPGHVPGDCTVKWALRPEKLGTLLVEVHSGLEIVRGADLAPSYNLFHLVKTRRAKKPKHMSSSYLAWIPSSCAPLHFPKIGDPEPRVEGCGVPWCLEKGITQAGILCLVLDVL